MICGLRTAGAALAQDSLYLEEPNLYNVPKTLMVPSGQMWAPELRDNPALMKPDKDVVFLANLSYLGGYTTVDLDSALTIGSPLLIGFTGVASSSGEETYVTNGVAADAGVILKTSDMSHFGVMMKYRWLSTTMDGDQFQSFSAAAGALTGSFSSSLGRDITANDFSLGLFYNLEFSRAFALGMGFKYGYDNEKSDYNMVGSGTSTSFGPESASVNRELTLTSHRFAPVFGVSVKPTDSLTLGASVEAGFVTGGVDKDDVLFDNVPIVPAFLNTHSEVLKSGDLSGWGHQDGH